MEILLISATASRSWYAAVFGSWSAPADRTSTNRRRRAYEYEETPWHYVTGHPLLFCWGARGDDDIPELVDSGSRRGAAGHCQVRSEAVTVPGSTSLTCRNVVQQRLCRCARWVRIEGVRVQIPSAPPSSL